MGSEPVEPTIKELKAQIERLQKRAQCMSRDFDVFYKTEKLIVAAGLLDEEKFNEARELIGPLSSSDYAVIT